MIELWVASQSEPGRLELLDAMTVARKTLTLDRIAAIVGMSRQRVMRLLRR